MNNREKRIHKLTGFIKMDALCEFLFISRPTLTDNIKDNGPNMYDWLISPQYSLTCDNGEFNLVFDITKIMYFYFDQDLLPGIAHFLPESGMNDCWREQQQAGRGEHKVLILCPDIEGSVKCADCLFPGFRGSEFDVSAYKKGCLVTAFF